MTITIAPQTEAKLKEMAIREGREVSALADALLAAVVEAADRDFEESCEAITEALAGDPKQDIPFEVYQAQFESEREARRHTREGVKDKVAAGARKRPTMLCGSLHARRLTLMRLMPASWRW